MPNAASRLGPLAFLVSPTPKPYGAKEVALGLVKWTFWATVFYGTLLGSFALYHARYGEGPKAAAVVQYHDQNPELIAGPFATGGGMEGCASAALSARRNGFPTAVCVEMPQAQISRLPRASPQ